MFSREPFNVLSLLSSTADGTTRRSQISPPCNRRRPSPLKSRRLLCSSVHAELLHRSLQHNHALFSICSLTFAQSLPLRSALRFLFKNLTPSISPVIGTCEVDGRRSRSWTGVSSRIRFRNNGTKALKKTHSTSSAHVSNSEDSIAFVTVFRIYNSFGDASFHQQVLLWIICTVAGVKRALVVRIGIQILQRLCRSIWCRPYKPHILSFESFASGVRFAVASGESVALQ